MQLAHMKEKHEKLNHITGRDTKNKRPCNFPNKAKARAEKAWKNVTDMHPCMCVQHDLGIFMVNM